jgi:hypothetical protein
VSRIARWAPLLGLALQACAPTYRPATPAPAAAAPGDAVDVTLFLIGDAGAPAAASAGEPVLTALRTQVAVAPAPTIVYLGDNIYPRGMPDSSSGDRREAERRLGAQLQVVQLTAARGIFVPGNHDWSGGSNAGRAAVLRAEAFITAANAEVAMLPGGGCPGPAIVDIGTSLRLIAIDSQWWLQRNDPGADCLIKSPDDVVTALQTAGQSAAGRVVIVVGHHPLRSGGPHGGHFGWEAHLFPLRAWKSWLWLPLPVIGSIYPIARMNGVSSQDASSGAYHRMAAALDTALLQIHALVYAAGHDHGLQVIGGTNGRFLLVSGAGIYGHGARIVALDSTRYVRRAGGFMRLDVLRDRRVRLGVTVVDEAGRGSEEFSLWLQ